HNRLVAVLLELAVTERGHRSGRLGLRHRRRATTRCAIRPPDALRRPGRGLVQEAVRLELGRNLLDPLVDVRGLAGPRADDLAAAEQEDVSFRFLDAVDEAGELLRLVFGAAQAEGDRLEVELVPEGSRCDDVLDPELGHAILRG